MGKYIAWKMKAAICDDTVEDAAFMEKHIKEYFMKKSIPYECNVYQSSKALWYEIEDGQAFDLLFLDIEMQELNGFELAAKIQETAPDILIIFVSASRVMCINHLNSDHFVLFRSNKWKV